MPFLAAAQSVKTEPPKAAPRLTYQSAFADDQPDKDVPLAHWREVNDVGAPMPTKPETRMPTPMHGGHRQHGGQP